MHGYNNCSYRMHRMDYLMLKLIKLGDHEYVEEVLDVHRVIEIDPRPD